MSKGVRRVTKTKKTIGVLKNSRSAKASGNFWEFLSPGDRVDVIAPASSASEDHLRAAVRILESWGLVVHVPADLLDSQLFLSNTDEVRFRHLKESFQSSSKAIWCLRGGFGSMRILPQLSKLQKPKRTKLFVGLSDLTSLHVYMNQFWNWPTLHGPILDRLGSGVMPAADVQQMKDILFGKVSSLEYPLMSLNPAAEKALSSPSWQKKMNQQKKKIIGGNLVTFESSVGTPFYKPTSDFIFFEELAERAYRIDRIFHHLQYQKVFDRCSGIILGTFTKCVEPDGKEIWFETIRQWAKDKKFPVFYGLPCGHNDDQKPIFLNTPIEFKGKELSISTRGQL